MSFTDLCGMGTRNLHIKKKQNNQGDSEIKIIKYW